MELLEQKSYKETTLLFLAGGTILQTNNDIEFDENIRAGLEAAIYCAHCHYIDELTENFQEVKRHRTRKDL